MEWTSSDFFWIVLKIVWVWIELKSKSKRQRRIWNRRVIHLEPTPTVNGSLSCYSICMQWKRTFIKRRCRMKINIFFPTVLSRCFLPEFHSLKSQVISRVETYTQNLYYKLENRMYTFSSNINCSTDLNSLTTVGVCSWQTISFNITNLSLLLAYCAWIVRSSTRECHTWISKWAQNSINILAACVKLAGEGSAIAMKYTRSTLFQLYRNILLLTSTAEKKIGTPAKTFWMSEIRLSIFLFISSWVSKKYDVIRIIKSEITYQSKY